MNKVNDTIAAISTPPGRGGIGIVRLSGPEALAIAGRVLRWEAVPEAARATVMQVPDPAAPVRMLDEAVVTCFRAPRSYTAEDVVEIALHGSPVVLNAVLAALLDPSYEPHARAARAGEFTERAFLNGRLGLTEAEAVEALIAAKTAEQARTAAEQMSGALSRRVAPAKESLLHMIAFLEAGMDFASGELDDVEVVPKDEIAAAILRSRAPLDALAATFARGDLLREGAAVALVGPPNAGKSSLFNRLLERDRAIVTPVAGTTRDTLEEPLALAGIPLRLIDTAGLRESDDAIEAMGIARTEEALAEADLVLLLHDATLTMTEEEEALQRRLAERPHLLVLTKSDVAGGREGLRVSAVTGEGIEALKAAMLAALGGAAAGTETVVNNARQQQAIRTCLAALEEATHANEAGLPHEALLIDLHRALRALDELTGVTTTDDILARIFSAFCIGK